MSSCKFIRAGILTTIQDGGRQGLAYHAFPRSGPMDSAAARLANTLVGNQDSFPVIEFNLAGGKVVFNDKATIALTGCNMGWKINDNLIDQNETLFVSAGDTLSGGFGKDGLRSYLAIKGKIIGEEQLGSSASYSYAEIGYNNGKPLANDHILEWQQTDTPTSTVTVHTLKRKSSIAIYKGPEFVLLTEESINLLKNSSFTISSESNRMGARLLGPNLITTRVITDSVAVLPGFIQLTPAGKLIVSLQDGQTTGGYPRIAYIKDSDLSSFNQVRINRPFEFELVNG